MKKALKVVLVLVGILAGIVVLTGLGGYYWWNSNKVQLLAMGDKAKGEGKDFGTNKAGEACVTEALRRTEDCAGMTCEIEHKLFLKYCLRASLPQLSCEGVPRSNEILGSVAWLSEKCETLSKKNEEGCTKVLKAVIEHCNGP